MPRDSGLHTKQRSGLGTNRAAIQAPSLAPSPGQWVRPSRRGRPCLTGTQAPAGQRPPRGPVPSSCLASEGMLSPLCNPLRGLPCASASHLPAHGQRFLFLLCSGSRSAPSSRVSGSTSPFPFLLRDLNLQTPPNKSNTRAGPSASGRRSAGAPERGRSLISV